MEEKKGKPHCRFFYATTINQIGQTASPSTDQNLPAPSPSATATRINRKKWKRTSCKPTYMSAVSSPKESLPTMPADEALYPPMTLSSSSSVGAKPSGFQELWFTARTRTPADTDRRAS